MESPQSVHGRITYRRVEAVIDAKIEDLKYVQEKNASISELYDIIQFAVHSLQSVREEIRWRDEAKTWPLPR